MAEEPNRQNKQGEQNGGLEFGGAGKASGRRGIRIPPFELVFRKGLRFNLFFGFRLKSKLEGEGRGGSGVRGK